MNDSAPPTGFPVYASGHTDSSRAVIVLQEAFGVNGHIRNVADRFADEGYLAVAPQLFHRDGSPEIPYDDLPSAMTFMANLNKQGITNDLNATTDFLATLGFGASNIAAVGYCMGGTVAFFAATLGTIGATASFYGGGVATGRFGLPPLLELAADLKSPWLGLYGDLDQSIPVDQIEALREATDAAPVATEIVRYAAGKHGFHCDARPDAYNEAGARDAHARVLAFFAEHLSDK
ncbi:MAG TPA: dienelactone hydrolase family protein [Acidimicrobiales bacterium]|nr:dienelactone hydrolase family protein [Acidimicrobiales bacterium]